MHTKHIGDIAEVAVTLRALQKGWSVSQPVGENQRYDLILDDGVKLLKVQCKSAKLENNVVTASLSRMTKSNNKYKRAKYTPAEIDAFAIYCPDNNICYLVYTHELLTDTGLQSNINLRLTESTANNQHKVRMAKTYVF